MKLAHLRDGHVFWQWALARGQTATMARAILSAATLALRIRDQLHPDMSTRPDGLHRTKRVSSGSIEFDADISATELMTKAGLDLFRLHRSRWHLDLWVRGGASRAGRGTAG